MAFLRALSLYMVAALPLALAAAVEPAPTLTIAPGLELPYVSLGTGSGQKGDVENATAIWLGPGLDGAGVAIDTAYNYFDADAIAAGIADSGRTRDSIWLTTKVPCSSKDSARVHFEEQLAALEVSYVDLALIHWPTGCSDDEIYETWCALEDALSANQTRAIGISNFNETHLDHLAAHEPTVWPPAVNQVEMSVSFHDDAQIAATLQAFSPLCGGDNGSSCQDHGGMSVLDVPEVQDVAARYNVSTAQVGLKWVVQQGSPLATSIWRLDYMVEDLDLWSWGLLADDDMALLSAVYGGGKTKTPPPGGSE